jgi:hypothetical protein
MAMVARITDFVRHDVLTTATEASWESLHALNPGYVDRCQ